MVELTQEEMERLHEEERDYIVTWRRIYKIEWMANYKVPCFQLMEIPYLRLTKGNYALRGRYFCYTASDVNHLIKRFLSVTNIKRNTRANILSLFRMSISIYIGRIHEKIIEL